MRLSRIEKNVILSAIKCIDPHAAVYLFGSRVDNDKTGGDIDILICSETISLDGKLKIKSEIFKRLDEQKLDLIIRNDMADPFVQMVLENGIRLI